MTRFLIDVAIAGVCGTIAYIAASALTGDDSSVPTIALAVGVAIGLAVGEALDTRKRTD